MVGRARVGPASDSFWTPSCVANVLIPNFLSPITSGRSLVMAMTTAKMVAKAVMNMMAGLQWNGSPIAARVAWYTPKLSRKPRTVAMIRKAGTAKRLSRRGGTLRWQVRRGRGTSLSATVRHAERLQGRGGKRPRNSAWRDTGTVKRKGQETGEDKRREWPGGEGGSKADGGNGDNGGESLGAVQWGA